MPAMMRAFNFSSVKKKQDVDNTSKQIFSTVIPILILITGSVSVIFAAIAIVY